mgnify:CR=1 FL=1
MGDVACDTITLKKPVTVQMKVAGETEPRDQIISTLELHPFKARDLRAIDGLEDNQKGSMLLALMARMVRQPIKVIDELEGEDFAVLAQKVQGFLPDGLLAGGTD